MWIFFALVCVSLAEIALFVEIGGWIGLGSTVGAVILTAMIGAMLLRRQGIAALTDLRNRLVEGRDPRSALAHGVLIFIAGIMLLTPGFFTDAVGFSFLIHPVRAALIRNIRLRMQADAPAESTWTRADEMTVDGDFTDVTPAEDPEAPGGDDRARRSRPIDRIVPPR